MGKKQSKLKDGELEELKRKTSFSEDEIKTWHNMFLYEFPKGKISLQAFQNYYRKFFPYGDPHSFSTIVFSVYDKKKKGKIEFSELLEALSITSRGSLEEKLKSAFHLYDINGDGQISRDEMLTVVKAIYQMMGHMIQIHVSNEEDTPEKRVNNIFTLMDKDRDDLITMEEFESGAKRDPTILQALVAPPAFSTDANHNSCD